MRAVTAPGDDRIEVTVRPDPRPGPGEVLVRVHGAGLNRADLLQRAGRYPAPAGVPADIPGLEFAGEVVEQGDGVHEPAVGARVFGIVAGGAQAELVVVHASHCAPVPAHLDLVAAGGVPEVFVTAHDALRTRGALEPGEHVLVHAVGSGVGTAVVQLAKAWHCTVTGTARTQDKLARAAALGLDHGVLATTVDPAELAAAITAAGGEPDVVIDLVGGPYVTADVLAAAAGGRIVVVGTLAGGTAAIPLLALMGKRLALHGTVLRSRTVAEKAAATAAFVREVVPLLDGRTVEPVVEQVVPLAEAADAYARLASNATFGKIILDAR
jgi:putative PIG3 family NAD(P)H quinone oxidoreductase